MQSIHVGISHQQALELANRGGRVYAPPSNGLAKSQSVKVMRVEGQKVVCRLRAVKGVSKTVESYGLHELSTERFTADDLHSNGNGASGFAVVLEADTPLFWSGAANVTKDHAKAKRFGRAKGANIACGHLRLGGTWVRMAGGKAENIKVVPWAHLSKYQPRNPLELQAEERLRAAEEHENRRDEHDAEHAPPPNRMAGHFDPDPLPFEVSAADFKALQDAYRDYEAAVIVTREGYDRVQTILRRISDRSKAGLPAAVGAE